MRREIIQRALVVSYILHLIPFISFYPFIIQVSQLSAAEVSSVAVVNPTPNTNLSILDPKDEVNTDRTLGGSEASGLDPLGDNWTYGSFGDMTSYPNVIGDNEPLPLNFGDLGKIDDPSAYPWRMNVRLFSYFKVGGADVGLICSGVLIDPMHVLTAGHCVYDHESGYGKTYKIDIEPGYRHFNTRFGMNGMKNIWTPDAWINSTDYNSDMAVVLLDRPVGALTGWFSYGSSENCSFFTTNTFHNSGYPNEPCGSGNSLGGEDLYYWYGNFDSCEIFTNFLTISRLAYKGMSGSGIYYIDGLSTAEPRVNASSRRIHGVASHCKSDILFGDRTRFVNISSALFSQIRGFIDSNTPSTFDLIPLNLQVGENYVKQGQQLSSMNYLVHNYSSTSWNGTVNAQVFLSPDPSNLVSGYMIQKHSFNLNLSPKSSYRVYVSPPPTIPTNVAPGSYVMSILLDIVDYDMTNNMMGDNDWVSFKISDGIPPTIQITSPTSNPTFTSQSTINISGTASDNVGVTQVTWLNSSTGANGTASGTTSWSSWSVNGITLNSGSNVITLTAWDAAGNKGTATLTVTYTPCTAPQITTQLQSPTIQSGQSTTLSVAAQGTAPLSYQWYLGSSPNTSNPINGTTSSSYPTPALTQTTSYWVRVSNGCGHADSNTATVTVTPACTAPQITTQPQSPTIQSGESTTLSVSASGTAPFSYQWYLGSSPNISSPINGATSSSYPTPALTQTASYWVRVSNSCGHADSNTATVTVNTTFTLTINVSPAGGGSVTAGGTTYTTFPATVTGLSGTQAVNITANPASGYQFSSWSVSNATLGNASIASTTVTMNNADAIITATFTQPPPPPPDCTYTLTVNVNPPGSGVVGFSLSKPTYCPGDQVTLIAYANSGYTFSSWNGVDSSNGTNGYITMNSNRTVTVNFSQNPQGLKALYLPNSGVDNPNVVQILNNYGFTIDKPSNIPSDLSSYQLVIVGSYDTNVVNSTSADYIKTFVQNGGGAIIMHGTPTLLAAGDDLTSIKDWFGAGIYTNDGGYGIISIPNPLGTNLTVNDEVDYSTTNCNCAAAVDNLDSSATLISKWTSGGYVHSFTHTFGSGRVFYYAGNPGYLDAPENANQVIFNNSIELFEAGLLWASNAAANTPPTANNQSISTPKNTPQAITLTATDPDGDQMTFSIVAYPSHGSLSGTPPNVTYTPYSNYTGSDSFTFKANDGKADSNIATVSITVTSTNTPPTANNQSVSTTKNTPQAITLTATDPDGDQMTYSIVTYPSHGSLSGTPPNVTYTPTNNYTGSDSFTFKANDGRADSNIATVSITVTSTNTPPTAYSQSVSTPKNTSLGITLTATDPDVGDSLTFSIVSQPSHGSLSGTPPNVTYTPTTNYTGSDSFTFKANDGKADSNIATVSITVTDVPSVLTLVTPLDGASFDGCSLNAIPAFAWSAGYSCKSYEVQFSSDQSFSSIPVRVKASGTTTQITVKSSAWKNILLMPGVSGGMAYWRLVGTKSDRTTVLSEVRSLNIGSSQAVDINSPQNGAYLPPDTPPTFDFDPNCNVKFKLEISSLDTFGDSSKIKSFNLTSKVPNEGVSVKLTLSSKQWFTVMKLVGTGTGYFRISAWDGINRYSVTEVRAFTTQRKQGT